MDVAKRKTEYSFIQIQTELTELENRLSSSPVDINNVLEQLEYADQELEIYLRHQEHYSNLLCTAGNDADFKSQEDQQRQIRKTRTILGRKVQQVCGGSTSQVPQSNVMDMSAYRIHLPRRDLPKFSGDVRQWKSFWASFKEVDSDKTIPDIEKYNYLLQQMVPGSSSAKVVASFPASDTSYDLAKKELEHRFGREKTLIKVYVRDLLTLVVENSKEKRACNFVDVVTTLQSQILNLEQLGVTPDKYGVLLYPIIESCIPVDVLNRYLDMPTVKEDMSDILDFLRKEVRRREESARAQSAFVTNSEKSQRGISKEIPNVPTAVSFLNTEEKINCCFCGNSHPATKCRKAWKMTLQARKDALRKTRCCFKCLQPGHHAQKCNLKSVCEGCKGDHHKLICTASSGAMQRIDQLNINPHPVETSSNYDTHVKINPHHIQTNTVGSSEWTFGPGPNMQPENSVKRTEMANYIRKPNILMQTLLVRVYDANNEYRVVRAIHDSGSQSSYVKQSLVNQLGYTSEGVECVVHQTFGGKLSAEMKHDVVRVDVSGLADPYLHRYRFQVSVVNDIVDNVMTVPNGPWLDECADNGIQLTDLSNVRDVEVLIGGDIAPYLNVEMRSKRLRTGLVARETRLGWYLEGKIPGTGGKSENKAMICVNMLTKDTDHFWALETIGIKDALENRTREELEEAALLHFNKTVKRDAVGRFEVNLPWIEGHPSLPDNRCQGKTVLHYLGHRAVIKENSTTPVRPVFNASGKTRLNPSLNECLEKGPNLLDIIPSILSRFRINKIGVIADIEKAFLQLQLAEEHRDCLRFLWWENIDKRREVVEYRHCRVVFGVSSSPFLLGAVIQRLLAENKDSYSDTVATLRKSFYVDNLVTSVDTLSEVITLKKQSTKIFQSAQMNLRDWVFGPIAEKRTTSVLGHLWNVQEDTLSFDISRLIKQIELITNHTKRTVLMMANSLFDPLGILSPVVIVVKVLFKKICDDERKFGWDTVLPECYQKEATKWGKQVSEVNKLAIPRYVGGQGAMTLHVMSDASKEAYSCCVFLRFENNKVNVNLIQARARVTPMKGLTIPRAELVASCIAARLYQQVIKDLGLSNIPVTFYTDSMTALTWIQTINVVYGVFVNRRVEEIRRLTNIKDWHHISGEVNPADLPSRGTTVGKYIVSKWWEGPDWLRGPLSEIPIMDSPVDEEEVGKEKRKTIVSALIVHDADNFIRSFARLGDWYKVIRVLAYVLRFLRNVDTRKKRSLYKGPLLQREIHVADVAIMKHIQKSLSAETCGKFRLTTDENGLLRVHTKILDTDDSFRRPILLPGNHELVRMLIMKEHLAVHAGVQYLMSILRERYWITNSRRSIKFAIKNCSVCKVDTAKRCQVIEAPLPLDRTKTTRCFDVTGIDLAGPLYLKGGKKVWIVLFTCAVYRAVHLEIVTALTTEAFLITFRKFIVRRGRPSTVYSDNGTNFRGCQNLFEALKWDRVEEYAAVEKIRWIFNAPTAAWWGGWWERLIGLTKQLVRRNLGTRTVDYYELELLLLEVESVLNERPLTYMSEEINDLQPLSPSLFMKDLPICHLPEFDASADQLRKGYRHIIRLKEQLRTRFRKEYLAQLVHRGKTSRTDHLKVGDVVLIEVEGRKRLTWPLGVIEEVFVGRDGVCRTARVRTSQGQIIRPFQRLFPLEMNDVDEDVEMDKIKPSSKPTSRVYSDGEEDYGTEEDLQSDEPEPVVITRYGRSCKQPMRF